MKKLKGSLIWSDEHECILCITNPDDNRGVKSDNTEVEFNPENCSIPTVDQLGNSDLDDFISEPENEEARENLTEEKAVD